MAKLLSLMLIRIEFLHSIRIRGKLINSIVREFMKTVPLWVPCVRLGIDKTLIGVSFQGQRMNFTAGSYKFITILQRPFKLEDSNLKSITLISGTELP